MMERFVFEVSRKVDELASVMIEGKNQADALKKLEGMREGLSWHGTGKESHFKVDGTRKLVNSKFQGVGSCDMCNDCNRHYQRCDHPAMIERFPNENNRLIPNESFYITVLDWCPLVKE